LDKTMSAPVSVIVADDLELNEKLPRRPRNPGLAFEEAGSIL
jgi:hypothetical protein